MSWNFNVVYFYCEIVLSYLGVLYEVNICILYKIVLFYEFFIGLVFFLDLFIIN